MENFLMHYGLFAVAFFALTEGDVTFIMAGVVAHLGFFGFFSVIIIGSLSSFVGDCVWFWVGRSRADSIRETHIYTRVGTTVEQLAERFGAWEIVTARFVYGTRIASSLFWGTQNLSFSRFAILDYFSCALWAGLLTALGFFMSRSASALIGEIKSIEIWLLVALVVAVGIFFVTKTVMGQRIKN